MATMTHNETTGERIFEVPIEGGVPGAIYHGPAALVLVTRQPGDRPASLELRFFPSEFEFQFKLPQLIEGGDFAFDASQVSYAAQGKQPIVVFEADAETLARVPAGIGDLDALETYLGSGELSLDLTRFSPTAIEFEQPDDA